MTYGNDEKSQREYIYQTLIEIGCKPSQARIIANSEGVLSLDAKTLIYLAGIITDDSGQYIIADTGTANLSDAIRHQVSIAQGLDTSDSGKVKQTPKVDTTPINVNNNPTIDEYKARLAAYNSRANSFNQTGGVDFTDAEKDWLASEREWLRQTRNSIQYPGLDKPTLDYTGTWSHTYYDKGDIEQKQRREAEEKQALANLEASNLAPPENLAPGVNPEDVTGLAAANQSYYQKLAQNYQTYRLGGGSLSRIDWEAAGMPKAYASLSTIYARNLPQNVTQNQQQWQNNAFGDVYNEFLAKDYQNPYTQSIKEQYEQPGRWEEYLKKIGSIGFLQRYKGTSPYSRGENTGKIAPRTRTLSY